MSKRFLLAACVCAALFGSIELNAAKVQASTSVQQARPVSGVVSDKMGPVSGAYVTVKGTTNGAITDADGKFTLSGVKSGDVLVVSYVGYASQEIPYTGQATVNVVLDDTLLLDEVLFVAYGTSKKSSFTGSASVVKSEQLEKISGTGFLEAMQGMSAGVQIVNNEGNPGGNPRIQIRGISAMSGITTPLYIVDGMPYDGSLNTINPSDIESMTVLKDAAASSLYGSRAANGVVVITTKKGKSGKPTVNVRAAWGTSDAAVPWMTKADPKEQLYNNWKALYNDQVYLHGADPKTAGDYASANAVSLSVNPVTNSAGQTWYVTPFQWPGSADKFVLHDGNGNGYVNPDLKYIWNKEDWEWNDIVFSYKLRQDIGVDVSGTSSNGKTNYFVSAGYLDDNGYANRDYYKRYSFRANVETEINKWLSMGGSLSYSYARQNYLGYNRMLNFHTSLNSVWLRNNDNTDWVYSAKTGERMYDWAYHNANYFGMPAVTRGDYWDNYNAESFTSRAFTTISSKYFVNFKLPAGFNFRSSISIDDNNAETFGYSSAVHDPEQIPPYGVTPKTSGGAASRETNHTMSSTWNNILTWDKSFGDHNLNAMLGHEFYDYTLYYNYAYGEGIMSISQYELANTTANWEASSDRVKYALLSFFGKADYNYKNKYFLSGSIRRDGSSRFSPESRWGNFWSVGASWRASNEPFIKEIPWIDNLVFRTSYGTSGNDRLYSRNSSNGSAGGLIQYAYQSYYASDNLYGVAGFKPSTVATPDLKWEKNQQFNVAVDFSLLRNRLTGTFEYYVRGSKDLLYYLELPLSAQVGDAEGYNTNLGNVSNSGIEITLGVIPVMTNNFVWNIDANFSTLKNVVTYLPSGAYTYNNRVASYRLEEGHSLYEFYMPQFAGVDPQTGLLSYKLHDGRVTTNYSEVTEEDYEWSGTAIPKAFGSITNSFKWGNVDFSFMWYGSFGAKLFDYIFCEAGTMRTGVGLMQDVVAPNAWMKPGDNALYPRWSYEKAGDNRKNSTFLLLNNNYVRLRNAALGYSLPKSLIQKVNISNVRFYVSGDNLLTFGAAARRHVDPETGILGNNYNGNAITDNGVQSSRRVYMAGVQLTF